MATVTGIIDGTGSVGAALGQVIVSANYPHLTILKIGLMQQKYGWNAIFIVLTITIYLSIIPLLRNFTKEIHEIFTIYKMKRRQAL